MKSLQKGFSLLEMLVVLAIMGITSHWMVNQYQSFIAVEKRRAAIATLLNLAAALEEYALIHSSYAEATLSNLHVAQLPAQQRYVLHINFTNTNHYLISAHPSADQAKYDINCGNLLLSSDGEKSVSGNSSWRQCW